MPALRFWGRWIAVLPAAIAAALLVSFPIHWAILATFTGDDKFITLPNSDLQNLERLALAFFTPLTLVSVGARVAPRHKVETAVALSGVLLLGFGLLYGYVLFAPQNWLAISPPVIVLNLLGVSVGVVQAWISQRQRTKDSRMAEALAYLSPSQTERFSVGDAVWDFDTGRRARVIAVHGDPVIDNIAYDLIYDGGGSGTGFGYALVRWTPEQDGDLRKRSGEIETMSASLLAAAKARSATNATRPTPPS
jgi:hypothetical protein